MIQYKFLDLFRFSFNKLLTRCRYDAVCGGYLVAKAVPQMIYSHAKYGDVNYDNRADCVWRILAEEGFVIQLQFRSFELEDEHECA